MYPSFPSPFSPLNSYSACAPSHCGSSHQTPHPPSATIWHTLCISKHFHTHDLFPVSHWPGFRAEGSDGPTGGSDQLQAPPGFNMGWNPSLSAAFLSWACLLTWQPFWFVIPGKSSLSWFLFFHSFYLDHQSCFSLELSKVNFSSPNLAIIHPTKFIWP